MEGTGKSWGESVKIVEELCFSLYLFRKLWWPSLTKDMKTERLLCWSGMTVTEHSTTSGSNEEASASDHPTFTHARNHSVSNLTDFTLFL